MDDTQPELIILDSDSPDSAESEYDETSDNEASCKDDVRLIFPNICPDYLAELALAHNFKSDAVISVILDKQEQGQGYPTQQAPGPHSRKRKRADGSDLDEESEDEGSERYPESVRSIKLKIAADEYAANTASAKYLALARVLISQDFPLVPQTIIRNYLLENKGSLFEAYTAMDDKLRSCGGNGIPWSEKKTPSRRKDEFALGNISNLDMTRYKAQEQAALTEFQAARDLRALKDAKGMAEAEERINFIQAQADNQTSDCGICFEECALNCMVPCEGDPTHWFCRKCMKHQAESQIGMARYELTCMSMDGCSAGFSHAQRALFLDKKLSVALDRIEQETVLRLAGIENLETCPFCPYAAEYPPAEVDKEFRCENPHCKQVSCRLCRKETHIPKSCAEQEADRGLDARHVLEEAMTEALIRRCNNCKNPFVKQDGCNKIKCTKCGALQCDVCRQTIKDYTHFNDQRRGGKAGRCPLFDQSEDRYEQEVSKAEADTRKKVVEENPGMDEETLRIRISEEAQRVEDRRKKNIPTHAGQWPRRFMRLQRDWGPALALELQRQMPVFQPHALADGLGLQILGEDGDNNQMLPGQAANGAAQPNPGRARLNLPAANEVLDQRALQQLWPPYLGLADYVDPNAIPIFPRRQNAPNIDDLLGKLTDLRGLFQANHPNLNDMGPRVPPLDFPPLGRLPARANPPAPGGARPGARLPRMDMPLNLPPGFAPNPFTGPIPLANRPVRGRNPAEPFPVSAVRDDPVREQDAPHHRR